MQIKRKRPGKTLPRMLASGPLRDLTFDGFHLIAHLTDCEGRDVQLFIEPREARSLADFVEPPRASGTR